MTIHILHHNDNDGVCAAAIVWNLYHKYDTEIKCHEMSYGKALPEGIDKRSDSVVIVDFSLQREQWRELAEMMKDQRVIWIDHHKTAIEQHFLENKILPGVRDIHKAAAQLTWEYFYSERPLPKIVQAVSDFDMWEFKYHDTEAICEAITLAGRRPHEEWWMDHLFKDTADQLYYEGSICLAYRNQKNATLAKDLAYRFDWYGKHCLACNCAFTGSKVFDSCDKIGIDIMIIFSWSKDKWSVSLYSDDPNIDCGGIAKTFGGGGHKGAAGFSCDQLPMQFGVH